MTDRHGFSDVRQTEQSSDEMMAALASLDGALGDEAYRRIVELMTWAKQQGIAVGGYAYGTGERPIVTGSQGPAAAGISGAVELLVATIAGIVSSQPPDQRFGLGVLLLQQAVLQMPARLRYNLGEPSSPPPDPPMNPA